MTTIVFDVETKPKVEAIDRLVIPFPKDPPEFEEFNPDKVALGRMKDPEKIQDKIEADRVKHAKDWEAKVEKFNREEEAYYSKVHDKAALSPGYSTICAIGWHVPGVEPATLMVGDNVETEKDLLLTWIEFVCEMLEEDSSLRFQFWDASMNVHENFDLNHIEKAAMRLGLKLPAHFWATPGQRGSIFENLRLVFGRHGGFFADSSYPDFLSLNRAVEIFDGFGQVADEILKGEDLIVSSKEDLEVDGASFWKFLEAGELDAARAYLRNDLAATRFLANLHPFRSGTAGLGE